MSIFNWNYLLAAGFVVLLYRFIAPSWRLKVIAFSSLAWVFFQKPELGNAFPMAERVFGFVFFLVTAALMAYGQFFARRIHRTENLRHKKRRLIFAIIGSLFPFLFFRYLLGRIFLGQIPFLNPQSILEIGAVLAPLGISYFTFRILCYLIEVYRGKIEPIGNLEYITYVAFFPTLLAGPIERVVPFVKQLRQGRNADMNDITAGFVRILQGLVKKLVIGNALAQFSQPLTALPPLSPMFLGQLDKFSSGELWFCTLAWWLYLYFDFSGYSDIAIGTGRLFGLRIMENFHYPIFATSISQFWQRWHISLTGWIGDFVYKPLGGSKKGEWRGVINTVLAMVVVGMWHGAGGHYALFGFYSGLCLVVNRLWRRFRKRFLPFIKPSIPGKVLGWALTMIVFTVGAVLFNFTLGQSLWIYAKMFFIR